MKLFLNHFTTAWHSLSTNRLRSLLTMTGVAIGVASITTILSLTFGLTESIERQVDKLGSSIAVIRPGVDSFDDNDDILRSPLAPHKFNTSTLTETDLDRVQAVSDELTVAPVMTIGGTLSTKDTKVSNATALATTPNFIETASLEIAEGQFLGTETDGGVAVLGQQLAIDLFGMEIPIGAQFELRDQTFTVIGVLERKTSPINYNNTNFNRTAIISFETGKSFNQSHSQLQQINIAADSKAELQEHLPEVKSALTQAHGGEKDFTVVTSEAIAEPTNELFKAMSLVMISIAAISIVVGGIGIMNIMLVGVSERTREIGIRKAVGASNGNIIWQFMIESLLISFIGGMIGYVVGLGAAWMLGSVLYVVPSLSWQVAVVALVLSLGTGAVFGSYPAIRASRKDPIESLRQYR